MKEHNFGTSKQQEPVDVEQRLTAYYGPPLPEQPLSQASWQDLRLRLGSQEKAGRRRYRRHVRWHLSRKRPRADVPAFIWDAFARIGYQARVPARPSMLRCSLKPHVHEPAVHSSWFGRRTIRLTLPLNARTTMGQAELDVVLATGLARCMGARKPGYTFGRLLLMGVGLMAGITLMLLWMHHLPLVGLPIAVALCVGVVLSLHLQARSLAFYADTLIVRWLGREHVCRGLHALADGSRRPKRGRWGEPSLSKRIERVCGTRVETKENLLTLVG